MHNPRKSGQTAGCTERHGVGACKHSSGKLETWNRDSSSAKLRLGLRPEAWCQIVPSWGALILSQCSCFSLRLWLAVGLTCITQTHLEDHIWQAVVMSGVPAVLANSACKELTVLHCLNSLGGLRTRMCLGTAENAPALPGLLRSTNKGN